MKTFLALVCIIALASATYTSNWTQCTHSEWRPDGVSVTKSPKTKNDTLVSACGVVVYAHGFSLFKNLLVNGTDGVHTWEKSVSYQYDVPQGVPFCLNFTSDFQNKDVSMRISGINYFGDVIGCIDIDLKYSDSKFLSF